MAIGTYAELQTAAANWLGRTDLTSRITEFIALAEARINRQIIKHRVGQVSTTPLSASGEWVAVPTDFAAARLLVLDGSVQRVLEYKPPERLLLDHPSVSANMPRWFTIHGMEFQLRPIPDGAYTLILYYYKKVTPLSGGAPTNWVLTNHPDLYLYGTLLEASPYLEDTAQAAVWKAGWDQALADLVAFDEGLHWSGGSLRTRTNVPMIRGM